MLVITRQKGQVIHIGDDIEVMVVDVDGDRVRLGINAPRSIPVLRSELIEATKDANKAAASTNVSPTDLVAMMNKRK